MTRIYSGTATVENGSTTVVIAAGDPLTSANCPADAPISLDGVGYHVASRTDTTTLELLRAYEGADGPVAVEIDPLTPDALSVVNIAVLVARVQAQLNVLDKNSQGLFYNRIGVTGDTDPAPGNLAFDDGNPTAVTEFYIDNLDANQRPVTGLLNLWTAGTIVLIRSLATSAYVAYRLPSGIAAQSGYYKAGAQYVDHDGVLADGEAVSIGWFRVGEGLEIDATGTYAGRTAFNTADAGFVYLSSNGNGTTVTVAALFRKNSATSGDWSAAVPFQGIAGDRGWAPRFAVVADGERRVLQLAGYVGGSGTTPTANVGQYVSTGGYTATIGSATDIRGAAGADGEDGADGDNGDDGAPGLDGTDPGIFLIWDDGTTDANPGAGVMRANNALATSATFLYISKANRVGSDISVFLSTLDDFSSTRKGIITLTRPSDKAQATFDVITLTDATDYVKVGIINGGGQTFLDNDLISFQFASSGDKGLDGLGAGNFVTEADPAIDPTGNLVAFSDDTGTAGKDTGIPSDDVPRRSLNGTDFGDRNATRDNLHRNGADIASAATVNLETATGAFVEVTGTTTTTAITLSDGHQRLVRAAAAWPLTHSTNLQIQGGASYTCVAGDLLLVQADGAVVRVTVFPSTFAKSTSLLNAVVGDSGSGGTKGLVPAPAVGDAAAGKFLKADGQWAVPLSPASPQARLSLTADVATPESDVAAATAIYLVPCGGNSLPIFDGASFGVKSIGSGLSLALDGTAAHAGYHRSASIFDLFAFDDAGTIRLGTGPFWRKTSTVTMTIASPAVISWTSHGLVDGAPIVFTTTGALPTGLTAGTTYFVKSPSTSAFNVATTAGGAAINTTGSQSGIHTAVASADTDRGTGAGSSELEAYLGFPVNKNAITVRFGNASGNTVSVAARKATYLGSFRATANGQATDTKAKRLLFNAYNQAVRVVRVNETVQNWTYSTAAWRQANGNAANKIELINGLAGGAVDIDLILAASNSTATTRNIKAAIGLDSITARADGCTGAVGGVSNVTAVAFTTKYVGNPGIGYHYLSWLEFGAGSDAQTFFGKDILNDNYDFGMYGTVVI